MRLKSIIVSVTFFFAFFMRADVMYEMTTKSTGMLGMGDSETLMRIFIKGDRSRTEAFSNSTKMGEMANSYIFRLDKGVLWTLDDANKRYMETKLQNPVAGTDLKCVDSTKVRPEIKIEFGDQTKKILDYECKKISIGLELGGNEGEFHLAQTMWVAESIPGVDELKAYNRKLIEIGGGMTQSAPMGLDKAALEEFMNKANEINGFPLEIELTMTISVEEMAMEIKTSSVITKFSVVPISNKVFELPEGYLPYE